MLRVYKNRFLYLVYVYPPSLSFPSLGPVGFAAATLDAKLSQDADLVMLGDAGLLRGRRIRPDSGAPLVDDPD